MPKNKFQIVFSDVDGTLLNKNRELSSNTIQQIRRLTDKNIHFVMVSARMPAGMQHLYREIPLNGPAICYNGALILKEIEKGATNDNILQSIGIDYEVASKIYMDCLKNNLHFSIYSLTNWYANKNDEWRLREENNTRVQATICNNPLSTLIEMGKKQLPVHKVMVMGESILIDALFNKISAYFSHKVNAYRSKDTYIEVTPASVNKATGCLTLLNYLNLSPAQAIAFGDNHNDTEMLKMVGLGVAMSNAPNELKAIAKIIAPLNIEDGVAKIIEQVILPK